MVMACFRGNLEPINLGNFWDQKRQSDSFHLVVWHTFVSTSSFDPTNQSEFIFFCCLVLSCPPEKETFGPISESDGWAAESFMLPSL